MMSFRRFAVGAGVEPAHSDLINDKLAGFVVNPYHLSISFSAPTRRVGVYTNSVRRFTTLQFSCPSRIRTSTNSTKNYRTTVILKGIQRKDRDSNPRTCYSCRFSRPVHSTTLPSFRFEVGHWKPYNWCASAYGLSTPVMLLHRTPTLSPNSDSNWGPNHYKWFALPTELSRHYSGVSNHALQTLILIYHQPLELDIVSNGPAYIWNVLNSQRF